MVDEVVLAANTCVRRRSTRLLWKKKVVFI
jgi:hypothetical protein